ncbi:hypothetical protein BDV93DRAFT_411471, partial [Ceratobasidium sp. AG-I]
EATGIVPYQYQVNVPAAIYSGRDMLCVAGTGSGKTCAFVMICFMPQDAIVWIKSPLNFIEIQLNEQLRAWGLCSIIFN